MSYKRIDIRIIITKIISENRLLFKQGNAGILQYIRESSTWLLNSIIYNWWHQADNYCRTRIFKFSDSENEIMFVICIRQSKMRAWNQFIFSMHCLFKSFFYCFFRPFIAMTLLWLAVTRKIMFNFKIFFCYCASTCFKNQTFF